MWTKIDYKYLGPKLRNSRGDNVRLSQELSFFKNLIFKIDFGGMHRDRAEGGAGGALSPPLFCKNKNKLNKK